MGEANIFRLLEDFYTALEASAIRKIFPDDMQAASQKSAAFFVGLLGGPPLFHQRHGPPRLRSRHLPFPIDDTARQEWLRVFFATLEGAEEKYDFPAEHLPGFRDFLTSFSSWMVNRRSDAE